MLASLLLSALAFWPTGTSAAEKVVYFGDSHSGNPNYKASVLKELRTVATAESVYLSRDGSSAGNWIKGAPAIIDRKTQKVLVPPVPKASELSRDAGTAVLALGTNFLLYPPTGIKKQLNGLIDSIRAENPNALCIVVGPPPNAFVSKYQGYYKEYYRVLGEVAKTKNCQVVDSREYFITLKDFSAPNPNGKGKIAVYPKQLPQPPEVKGKPISAYCPAAKDWPYRGDCTHLTAWPKVASGWGTFVGKKIAGLVRKFHPDSGTSLTAPPIAAPAH